MKLGNKILYADNAATTKLDEEAFEAMKPFLLDNYGNVSQPYSFSRENKRALKTARELIAGCIGALPEEIYFTSGGSESNNWAIKDSAFYHGRSKTIITSQIEHHSVLNCCKSVESLGYPVAYIRVDEKGIIQPEKLEKALSAPVLVSIMLANNEIGTIEPVRELADIAHSKGALFHTDAVQALGHIKINVQELGVDMLSASAHKFNGPKGIGFLYIKKGTPLNPYLSIRKRGAKMDCVYRYPSPIGSMIMASNGISLTGLWFDGQKYFAQTLSEPYEEKLLPVFEDTIKWLDIYFGGAVPDFTPELYIHSTPFRKAVYDILLTIPYGQTKTYGEIAEILARQTGKKKMSAQAVGGAVGHNPISIIIPCHRVVGADGRLTGYAGGIDRKRFLLELEGNTTGRNSDA